MISRWLAAIAIVLSASCGNAQVFFQGQVHQIAPPNPFNAQVTIVPSLVKPQGFPAVNWNNPANRGLVFYGFDTGLGSYTLLADTFGGSVSGSAGHGIFPPLKYNIGGGSPGIGVNPSAYPTRGSTRYGSGLKWTGAAMDDAGYAVTSFVYDSDYLRNLHNLWNAAAGVGWTIGATFVVSGNCDASSGTCVIFGRGANGFIESTCNTPCAASALTINSSGVVGVYYHDHTVTTPSPQTATGVLCSCAAALNVQHTLIATFLNVSAGSATITVYLDGAVVATATSTQPQDTGGNNEEQINFGGYNHLTVSTQDGNVLLGYDFNGMYWNRALGAAEVAAISTKTGNPWNQLR
jgi:hypothetical protein